METITITKKEYEALVFAKPFLEKKKPARKKFNWQVGFGAMKNSFGKASSVSVVNKMRKSWRA